MLAYIISPCKFPNGSVPISTSCKIMLDNAPDVLSLKDLRKTLQIGKNSALYLVQNGIIPACKVMGKWRILKEDVIEYITHT